MEFTAVYATYIVNKGVNRVVYFFCKYDIHDYATWYFMYCIFSRSPI